MTSSRAALVIVLSEIRSDPRVIRQIGWLAQAGWIVDSVGLGPRPADDVRDHFELGTQSTWVRSRIGSLIVYGLLPRQLMFRLLVGNRIPLAARDRISSGEYDVIVFDDYDFIPLVRDRKVFTRAALQAHIHLDLHEYRVRRVGRVHRASAWRLLTSRYFNWLREMIGDTAFDSRSTVASRIAELYAEDFEIESPVVVRSIPPYADLDPSPVSPSNIKLVYHGMVSRSRGLWEIVDAMRLVDKRFSMTFMLTGNPETIAELRAYASNQGDTISFVPPVPMPDISSTINQYDLEVMFFKPVSQNLEFALPNKLFEAVQGRLGLVIGQSPMMVEIVEQYGNGIVVHGWTPTDLAGALNSLTAGDIASLKAASRSAARDLNAAHEGTTFLNAIGIAHGQSASSS